jgi:hypothetical protein
MTGWAFGPDEFTHFGGEQDRPEDSARQGCGILLKLQARVNQPDLKAERQKHVNAARPNEDDVSPSGSTATGKRLPLNWTSTARRAREPPASTPSRITSQPAAVHRIRGLGPAKRSAL